MADFTISGNIVDILNRKIFPGTITVVNGKIQSLIADDSINARQFILPGFIDSHIHIESSLLIPSEFARLAVVHGTVATVSDPHEIGNVLGVAGIRYMLENAKLVPFHFYFGAPSCVPATTFETAGAVITASDIHTLLKDDQLHYLSEMMNFPGVLSGDPIVMEKIAVAKQLNKPIDGHAPGMRGKEAKRYIDAGISTDHECFTLAEALDKANYGMQIIIREGSAAKNYDALHPLFKTHPSQLMFGSDDKHPNELVKGHINALVKRSIVDHKYDLMDVLCSATLNPINHYKLDVGLLRQGDWADFIVVDNLQDFTILKTYIKGILVANEGKTLIDSNEVSAINHFSVSAINEESLKLTVNPQQLPKTIKVIETHDGQLVTDLLIESPCIKDNQLISDLHKDNLKIAVINRYQQQPPAIAFIRGFGFKRGAIASSVAHDSHNIIVVGTTDKEMALAVNTLVANRGGVVVVEGTHVDCLPLEVAGLMSTREGYIVADHYERLDQKAKALGSSLAAPFMTLSFMALLVIPTLKLSDQGLFDGHAFAFTPVCN